MKTNALIVSLCISIIAFNPSCERRERWDPNLDSNSDSLVRLKSRRNQALVNRGERLLIYESDRNGISFSDKLENNYSHKWQYLSSDIPIVISGLRDVISGESISADDFIPLCQIILIDKSNVIIGHWRIRYSAINSDETAIVFPSGGMYKLKEFDDFRDRFMTQE